MYASLFDIQIDSENTRFLPQKPLPVDLNEQYQTFASADRLGSWSFLHLPTAILDQSKSVLLRIHHGNALDVCHIRFEGRLQPRSDGQDRGWFHVSPSSLLPHFWTWCLFRMGDWSKCCLGFQVPFSGFPLERGDYSNTNQVRNQPRKGFWSSTHELYRRLWS